MTHAESRARNKLMREAAPGKTIEQVAQMFGVSRDTAWRACRGLCERLATHTPNQAFRILAELLNTDQTYEQIGKDFKVSRQRVGQIFQLAKAAGIKFWNRTHG